jgi:hypothetical protein
MPLLRIFLYQTLLELKRKVLLPLFIAFIAILAIILVVSSTVENPIERAQLFIEWAFTSTTTLLFLVFCLFFSLSWDSLKERKLAQVDFSKPVSKFAYFLIKYTCFSIYLFSLSVFFGILLNIVGILLYKNNFLSLKKLYLAIPVSDYTARQIRTEGEMWFGSKLKENIMIADSENPGEIELVFYIFKEYTKQHDYYLYFKAQHFADKTIKSLTYLRFTMYSDTNLDDKEIHDERIISMEHHFIKIPNRFFEKPSRLYVKIERLDKNAYFRFDISEPQIIYTKEWQGKTIFKELVFAGLTAWQSATPSYFLSAFVSPPTAIVGTFIFWIWANSKELLKAGRHHGKAKLVTEEEKKPFHKSESIEFPLWLEKIAVFVNSLIDKAIPDFQKLDFTIRAEKRITYSDSEFLYITLTSLLTNIVLAFIVGILFKAYEFPL